MRIPIKFLGLCIVALGMTATAHAQETAAQEESLLSTTPYGVTSTCGTYGNGVITGTGTTGVMVCNPYITMYASNVGSNSYNALFIWDPISEDNQISLTASNYGGATISMDDGNGDNEVYMGTGSNGPGGGFLQLYDNNINTDLSLSASPTTGGTLEIFDNESDDNIQMSGMDGAVLLSGSSNPFYLGGGVSLNGNTGSGVFHGTLALPALGSSTAPICTTTGGVLTNSGCEASSAAALSGTSLSSSVTSSSLTSVGTLSSLNVSGNTNLGGSYLTAPLSVGGSSGTTQAAIAAFSNQTNGASTELSAAGTSSAVGTWTNGSQILEFVPVSGGNGIVSAYTGSLLFQTNGRANQMAITSAGNVGIGTTTPSTLLTLQGAQSTAGNFGESEILRLGTGAANGQSWGMTVQNSSAGDILILGQSSSAYTSGGNLGWVGNSTGFLYYPTEFRIGTGTGSAPAMEFSSSGNVGIGTATPAYALDVAGAIHSSTGIVFPDGTTQATAASAGGSTSVTTVGTITSGTWNGSPLTASYLPSDVDYIDAAQTISGQKTFSSNVGIGTATPSGKLDVRMDSAYGNAAIAIPATSDQNPRLAFYRPTGGGANTYPFYLAEIGGNLAFQSGAAAAIGSESMSTVAVITNSGNLGIGTTTPGAKLEVDGNVLLTSGSGASITFQDGSVQATAWDGTAPGGDYAEAVDVIGNRQQYEPGDVMVIDPASPDKFLKSAEPYSTMVAGIYSTKPGLTGRRQSVDQASNPVPMAMMGIVPTKVTAENGAIKPGDLMVASSTPGYAMKGTDRERLMGAVIGKAMGHLDSGTGVIEVLVSLQ